MTPTALTDEQILSTLVQVAAENPEKVYQAPESMLDRYNSCFYVHEAEDGTQEPGCIVGQVLHRLGVPLVALKEAETLGASSAVQLTTQGVSRDVALFLRFVQRKQDRGSTWSEAVAEGLEDFNEGFETEAKLTLPALVEAAT
ncbi:MULTISPECIES: hypothetical protein [unclassified Streptomyces]|uniref:hypothetical protein n=1 Tax=unclassified Streptomyces TaxID=2593676 RepID=UPI0035E16B3B